MEHTEYYQLSLWEQDDRIQMENFNTDNQKIDAALAEKAAAATVTAQISALQNAMPRIVTGSWTGDGGATRTISLPFTPKFVYLAGSYCITNDIKPWKAFILPDRNDSNWMSGSTYKYERNLPIGIVENGLSVTATWGNYSGYTYHYFAIG